MALWTPAALGTNLLAWFDGADAASITISGSGVSAWTNKGASTFAATQTNNAWRPTYPANYVAFTGPQFLSGINRFPSYDLLVVGQPVASAADWRTLILSGSDLDVIAAIPDTTFSPGSPAYGAYSNGVFGQAGTLTWTGGTDGLAYGRISSAGPMQFSRDGSAVFSTGVTPTGDSGIASLGSAAGYAGGGQAISQAWGRIYELILVPYNSSDDTRQKLEGYAAWKWGLQGLLPSGHPYKTAAPQAASTAAGNRVTQAGDRRVTQAAVQRLTEGDRPALGTAAITLASVSLTGTGKVTVQGTAAGTLLPMVLVATGTVVSNISTGTLNATLASLALSGTGTVANAVSTGTLVVTLGALTGTLSGKVTVSGTAAGTLLPVVLVGTGTVANIVFTGTLNATLGNLTLSASGLVITAPRIGTLAVTLDDLVLSAHGHTFLPWTTEARRFQVWTKQAASPAVGITYRTAENTNRRITEAYDVRIIDGLSWAIEPRVYGTWVTERFGFTGVSNRRLTQSDDRRVTEASDIRVLEDSSLWITRAPSPVNIWTKE